MIQIEKLTKSFAGGKIAVNEINLNVPKGEIFALLGPNGAGKTTTIRVLTTLAGFDSGNVMIAGHNVDTDPDKVRASIGLVAQQTGVDFLLTGRENLYLQGQLYHLAKAEIESRIKELATYFELNDALDKQVMTYSGGMRRKLDIATALIHKPKVLFLDEPTLGLDIKSRKSLWRYIEKLNHEFELTILLTTHYLEEADQLSHRVAIINNGQICIVDTAENLKSGISGDAITLNFHSKNAQTERFAESLKQSGIAKHYQWQGNNLHIYVEHGASAVPKVVNQASEAQLEIDELSLARPSLDDVFLRYTGTTLTDGGEEEGGEEWWHQWAGKGGSGAWSKKWQNDQSASDTSSEGEPWWKAEQEKWAALGKNTDDWQKWQNQDRNKEKSDDTQPSGNESSTEEEPWWKAEQEKWAKQGKSTDDWQKWQKDDNK
jgi:ABC-2 type transport system ATP-binding protein